MNNTRATSPLVTARPRNSSSSIASSHAASTSQTPPAMSASSSKTRAAPPSTRSPAAVPGESRPGRPASKDSLKQKMAIKSEDPSRSSKTDELKALRSDMDSMRSHLTCKICDRLLYQPYTVSCGHTYCYSCLCTWFVANKANKTCPDCRTTVTQLPISAYVIRDLVAVVISRADTLPSDETLEQHKKWQKEEADAVQADKDNNDPRSGGLFKGVFKVNQQPGPLQVIRDQEDGVERCPVCSWELEDGECVQCGLFFDENGELAWQDSFTGFSDVDEMSEQDMSGEDMDTDMDEGDYYGGHADGWADYYPTEGNLMMQRFLNHPQAAYLQRRRPMSHSEAGSRRSYSQSIVSDLITEEMDTVEEEDEDGAEEGEDSSMNDFIDDDEEHSSVSAGASSVSGQTPQPSSMRSRPGRTQRVVESEASSTISSVIEEEEDEEEDEGPVRRGQRNRAQTRILNRANGSREPSGPPSSTSTDASADDLDEDTQALLQSQGWMLQHHGHDGMGEDDDSDGGRTTIGSTVGWDATAISNDRVRMGGSLTPTADQPRPNATIRPPSRVGNPLRRQTPVLSPQNPHYEDGEADDDDSDLDQGDITMAINSLRNRRSRTQLRNNPTFTQYHNRYMNRDPLGNTLQQEMDDSSDHSQDGQRRARQQTYNPRISRLFADHQRALQEIQAGPLVDIEPRSITPIARPRTANRNRPSPAQAFSPFMPPARLRTPLMETSSGPMFNPRMPISPPRRATRTPNLSEVVNLDGAAAATSGRASSASSVSSSSAVLTPGTSTPTSQQSSATLPSSHAGLAIDTSERPPSRVTSRPPSATGRRGSAGFSPVYAQFPHATNVGINIQGRIFPQQAGNPWGAFVQPRIRNRSSRQVLREQSSTATLRPASSRTNIRENVVSPQGVRPQASRVELRPQPSRRRLNNQASVRTLRASEHARPPQSPTTGSANGAHAAPHTSRRTGEETDRLARELINTRMQVLRPPGTTPARNNPFVPGFRRPNANENPAMAGAPVPFHTRSNSNESNNSGVSSHTATGEPTSPVLTRRRSNRLINATPPGVLPPSQGAFQPGPAYPNYFRARQNSVGNGTSAYDRPLDANARGISPMVATSLI